MRLRFAHGRKGASELVVALGRGEALDVRCAAWLRGVTHKNYLPFSYRTHVRGAGATLRYDVSGLRSVRSYLRRPRTGADLARLLVSLAEALAWCTAANRRVDTILFGTAHAFVGADGTLRLALVPVGRPAAAPAGSPLTLLHALGDTRRLRLATPADVALAERVAAYVLAAEHVFSLNDYRAFVLSECHVNVRADGTLAARGGVAPAAGDLAASPDAVRTQLVGASAAYRLLRPATGESFVLAEGVEVSVGRGSACGVRLVGNPRVSRRHAAVTCVGTTVTLRDLGSANGTTVDGAPVAGIVRLPLGHPFRLANEELRVVRE